MDSERIAYTATEVAEMLSISLVQIRRFTASGRLPCRRLGRSVRYTHSDIDAFLVECGDSVYD